MGKLYPVEQVDREFAADYARNQIGLELAADRIERGGMDDHFIVQIFARHHSEILTRIEATPAVDREGVREAVRALIEKHVYQPGGIDLLGACDGQLELADAIMALHPVKQSDDRTIRNFLIVAERVREACAKVAENASWDMPIDEWMALTKKEHGARACHEIASAIRSLDITRMDSDEQV